MVRNVAMGEVPSSDGGPAKAGMRKRTFSDSVTK